jgi:hypothetical protein
MGVVVVVVRGRGHSDNLSFIFNRPSICNHNHNEKKIVIDNYSQRVFNTLRFDRLGYNLQLVNGSQYLVEVYFNDLPQFPCKLHMYLI